MIGEFAKSKAGRDKDHLYIIVEEKEGYVYLVDGIYKLLEKPKKKKKKHIQLAYNKIDRNIKEKLKNNLAVQNEEIKRVIKLYKAGSQI